MLVQEFLKQVDKEPLSSDAAPGYYMGLFLAILDEFRDEKCSVLLGKVMANMTPWLRERAGVRVRDIKPGVVEEFEDCTEKNPCCDRRNEYNGFASGPLKFVCPKHCSCHD